MEKNDSREANAAENPAKAKKPVCVWSAVSLIVSIAAFAAYMLIFRYRGIIPVWVILSVVAIFLPAYAKHRRLSGDLSGKGLEITAIVIGGAALAMVPYLLLNLPYFVAYLSWVVGGVTYSQVKR